MRLEIDSLRMSRAVADSGGFTGAPTRLLAKCVARRPVSSVRQGSSG